MAAELSPPLPRIRLRIGVSGHRLPPKLPAEADAPLRAALDGILATIVASARESNHGSAPTRPARAAPEFVIVSSLAEGADRLVAEAGQSAGFALEAVLPFGRAEYARDFASAASRAVFERLLGTASAVFELDGAADARGRAYEAAGFVMLANVDLLIAIWDGEDAAGLGGTGQIVNRAIADGIPVIRLDPQHPDAMLISWSQPGDLPPAHAHSPHRHTFRNADAATVDRIIQDLLSEPNESKASLPQYLDERERRWNFWPWYPLLLCFFGVRLPRLSEFRLPPALADTQKQWESFFAKLPKDRAQRPALENILLPAFSAADHLSVFYSLIYRGTYVFSFAFAAIAVALAITGIFFIDKLPVKFDLVVAELAIIVLIMAAWILGSVRQWHRRWLQYRRLAECLRHMRILAPLGAEGPVSRPGVDVDGEDWVDWYTWSLRRLIPLPDRAADQDYIAAIRDIVRSEEIAGQTRYHHANARRLAALETRMHFAGLALFATTFAVCLAFVISYCFDILPKGDDPQHDHFLHLFTFVTALLPTVGAALGAINAQGEFKTRSEQSERTATRLAAIDELLAVEEPDFARLADRVQKTSDIMMADLEEWQTVFRARPLSLPA
jgi:hypothetical protein